jgi:hypothetical protein
MDFVAEWLTHLLRAMDEQLDDETKGTILAVCSETCTRHWATRACEIRAELQRLHPDEADVAALLGAFCEVLPGGGPDVQVEGSILSWRFSGDGCPCPIAGLVRNPDLCLCGVGHVRGMIEPLLGRPIAVRLERSRLRGDPECAYRIDCGYEPRKRD